MSIIPNLILLIKFSVILIYVSSCTKKNVKIFDHNHNREQIIVTSICKKTDASHFVVKNQKVILKRKNGNQIKLQHFKSVISDGYYFCSNQKRNSLILD